VSGYTFALPTEAEWQYAGQCGGQYLFNGNSNTWDAGYGWVAETSSNTSHAVGTAPKGKNIWLLQDMMGNVWEFCNDYDGAYPSSTTDPTGPSALTNGSVTDRGNSFIQSYTTYPVHARGNFPIGGYVYNLGFRVSAKKN
jgi:formylglycine-generating enzyme required for sulfatase activity